MASPSFDLRLYLVIGPVDSRGRTLEDVVSAAVAGGVTLVQLRDKDAPADALVEQAVCLKALLDPLDVPLIVNDRVDVALEASAAGVHLGQNDMPPEEARSLIGPERILGVSAGTPAEVSRVPTGLVDYVGIGPAFATATKSDAGAAIGPVGVASIRQALGLRAVAIGGINSSNAASVLASGVEGIAVVSAIAGADDPKVAARELRAIVDAARRN